VQSLKGIKYKPHWQRPDQSNTFQINVDFYKCVLMFASHCYNSRSRITDDANQLIKISDFKEPPQSSVRV